MRHGRSVYIALFDEYISHSETNGVTTLRNDSVSGEITNSTEYFRRLVKEGIIDAGFSFFAGSHTEVYDGKDPSKFLPKHNGWCLYLDNSFNESGTPFLISSNYRNTDDNMDEDVVVVLTGGSGQVAPKSMVIQAYPELFIPSKYLLCP